MRRTLFAGLTALETGESVYIDGASFVSRNMDTIDYLLEVGAVTHRHDGHAALADPTSALVDPTDTSLVYGAGGTIPVGVTLHVGYTLVDADGGETAISPITELLVAGGSDAPSAAVSAVADYTAGELAADTYYYGQTYVDGQGGETTIGPYVAVTREPGHASGQVLLSGLSPNGESWRLYRAVGGGQWALLATGSTNTFTDDGIVCDQQITPPAGNTTGADAELDVYIGAARIGLATSFRIYVSTSDLFSSPALMASGAAAESETVWVLQSLGDLLDGSPPPVSLSKPGANQIDPDTDILDWHWKRPVASRSLLGSGTLGDVRLATDSGVIYGVLTASGVLTGAEWVALASAGSSGGGHTIKDEGVALTQRTVIDFRGNGVTAVDSGGETVVTIPGMLPTASGTLQYVRAASGTIVAGASGVAFVGGTPVPSVTITGQGSSAVVEIGSAGTVRQVRDSDGHAVENPVGILFTASGGAIVAVSPNAGSAVVTISASGIQGPAGATGATGAAGAAGSPGAGSMTNVVAGSASYPATTGLRITIGDGLQLSSDETPTGSAHVHFAASGTVVTALPTLPYDGQQITFKDVALGIAWDFIYFAAAPGPYRWIFRGGAPIEEEVDTAQTTASDTFVALATAGPSITLPALAGDYLVSQGTLISSTSAAGGGQMSFDTGGSAAVALDGPRFDNGTIAATAQVARTKKKTGLPASTALVSKYERTNGAGTTTFQRRWMSVIPIRVG